MARRKKKAARKSRARRAPAKRRAPRAKAVTRYRTRRAARKTLAETLIGDGMAAVGGVGALGIHEGVYMMADKDDGESIKAYAKAAPIVSGLTGLALTFYKPTEAMGHGMIGATVFAVSSTLLFNYKMKKAMDKAAADAGTSGGAGPGALAEDPGVTTAARRLGLSAPPSFAPSRTGFLATGTTKRSRGWGGGRQSVGFLAQAKRGSAAMPHVGGVGFLAFQALP